ncbi:MAG: sterol desaturase family protein [Granulosicoccus sp.]
MTSKHDNSGKTATNFDASVLGKHDERGNWAPHKRLECAPVFIWPVQPAAFLHWLFKRYIFSFNLIYAAVATAFLLLLSPSAETTQTLSPGWIVYLWMRNAIAVVVFFGAWHLRLYTTRHQGTDFKYNPQWPKTDSSVFLFRKQNVDNIIWALASGVTIWTAFEVLMLWAHANGIVTPLIFSENPISFMLLMLCVPAFRDLHFYCTHRLLHIPFLYKHVHKLHHYNVNPGPWSGLAMHPLEHLLYFSGVLIHFVIPAHPIHILFQLVHAGLSPAAGHSGFDKILLDELGNEKAIDTHAYTHYLHHKHFECNYANGIIPMDKWFGTFHDGSPEAHVVMQQRRKKMSVGLGNG